VRGEREAPVGRQVEPPGMARGDGDQQGDRLTSSVGYTLTMDRTNDYLEPTRGWEINWSQDIAGLGGDVNYLRNEVRAAVYHGLWPGIRFITRLEAGYIESWGDEGVRINNRFFKGGNSFRGFDVAGLGPREVEYSLGTPQQIALDVGVPPPAFSIPDTNPDGTQKTNDSGQLLYLTAPRDEDGNLLPPRIQGGNALGGKAYAIGSLELTFPIPYVPEELGIDGAIFTEFGTVGLLDPADKERRFQADPFTVVRVDDSASLRASAGVSIFWDSPFGPIRFDFSQILAQEEYDRTETFRFATNTRF
jgi:outer membrane protein insertion porin family